MDWGPTIPLWTSPNMDIAGKQTCPRYETQPELVGLSTVTQLYAYTHSSYLRYLYVSTSHSYPLRDSVTCELDSAISPSRGPAALPSQNGALLSEQACQCHLTACRSRTDNPCNMGWHTSCLVMTWRSSLRNQEHNRIRGLWLDTCLGI